MSETSIVYFMIFGIAALILWRRTRSMYRPIRGSGLRILVPLLFIIPAISHFFNSELFMNIKENAFALSLGMVLSIPLIWTTNYEVREDNLIYAKKNWGFVLAFLGILLIRLFLRKELTGVDPQEKITLFIMVALGYIIPWRVLSFVKFRRLVHMSSSSS